MVLNCILYLSVPDINIARHEVYCVLHEVSIFVRVIMSLVPFSSFGSMP